MGKSKKKIQLTTLDVNVALQYFAVYIDCVDDTYLKLLQSCGALKVSIAALLEQGF